MILRSVLLAVALAALPPLSLGAADRFEPELYFPQESLVYVRADIGKIRRAFRESPLGALLFHPGVAKALGKLPALAATKLREVSAEFEAGMGMPLLDFIDLFQGEVAMTIPSVNARNGPRMFVAVELGARRKEMLAALDRLAKLAVDEGGAMRSSEKVRGRSIDLWDFTHGPTIEIADLDSHIAVYIAEDAPGGLKGVIERFAAGDKGGGIRAQSGFARAVAKSGVGESLATVFVDLKSVWKVTFDVMREGPFGADAEGEKGLRSFLEATGLDKVETVTYQLGLRDGDWEGKLLVESPGGLSGLFQVVAESFTAAKDPVPLDRVPISATQVTCGSVQVGRLVREVVARVRKALPDEAPEIDGIIRRVEEVMGVSLARQVYTLPRLDVYAFDARPPAGGILPDALMLLKAAEAKPYIALAEAVARKLGAETRELEILDQKLRYVRLGGLMSRLGLLPQVGAAEAVWLAFVDPAVALAYAPIDETWLVASSSPLSVARYLKTYRHETKLADDADVVAFVKGRAGSDAAFGYLRGGKTFLAGYNTCVSFANLAAPKLDRFLAPYGVDLAHLPAGELFASRFREGFILFRPQSDAILVHGHRFLTNSSFGAVAIAAGAAVSLVVPVRLARVESVAVDVGSVDDAPVLDTPVPPVSLSPGERQIRALGELFKAHMKQTGERAYPFDPAGSVASLQKLAASGVLTDPTALIHPLSSDRPARAGEGGRLMIAEENTSYVLVPWKQGPQDSPARILCYEKRPYERGGRQVLFVDLKVKFLNEEEFQRLFKEQSDRYAKKAVR